MLKRLTLVFILLALVVAIPFAIDIYRDRQHRVIVRGSVRVYQRPDPYWYDSSNPVSTTITAKDTPKIMRIRYGKDYMVIRIRLDNGQQGYIFYGDKFELL